MTSTSLKYIKNAKKNIWYYNTVGMAMKNGNSKCNAILAVVRQQSNYSCYG